MLLTMVTLICCIAAAKACLQCDRTIRKIHENFILTASTVQLQIDLAIIRDNAYEKYKEASQNRTGVIDPTTFSRVKNEYQNEFNLFLNTPDTGSKTSEFIAILTKGREILEKHLDAFIPNGLCPNTCGLLKRRVMDCLTCNYKIYTCPSPTGQLDCDDYMVEAEEGDQAVLNCFLKWHCLLLGRREYHYSWVPGTTQLDGSDFRVLLVTKDSSIILNQLRVDEQGTYRCSLQATNGTIFYQATFKLTVIPLPHQTRQPLITLPSLPHEESYSPFRPTEDPLMPVIATVTALSLAVSVGLTVFLR
ncbi:izumo sperm-egg fusion protein 1 [Pholidichthys leucotaenia]